MSSYLANAVNVNYKPSIDTEVLTHVGVQKYQATRAPKHVC